MHRRETGSGQRYVARLTADLPSGDSTKVLRDVTFPFCLRVLATVNSSRTTRATVAPGRFDAIG